MLCRGSDADQAASGVTRVQNSVGPEESPVSDCLLVEGVQLEN